METRDLSSDVKRRPKGGRGAARLALPALVLLAAGLLSGCGLLSKGPSQEEYDAVAAALEASNQQLEAALTDASKVAVVTAERDAASKEVEALKQELGVLKPELDRLRKVSERLTSNRLSLEKAKLVAIRFAQENKSVYAPNLVNTPLVWQVDSEKDGEEFYFIRLAYRPGGNFVGTPGLEEFVLDKSGKVEFRQVLSDPIEGVVQKEKKP